MKRNVLKSVICSLLIVAMLATSAPAFAASVVRIMKVNSDYVHMRNSASEGSNIITSLRKGTKLLYWGSRDDAMYKVMTSNGQVGYVYGAYLSTYGAMRMDRVFITTAATPMYNSSLKRIGTLAKGKYVMVYRASSNWAYVKTMSGVGAFVPTSTLTRAF